MTCFAARQGENFHIYATSDVYTSGTTVCHDEDVSNRVFADSDAAVMALRQPGELVVMVGLVSRVDDDRAHAVGFQRGGRSFDLIIGRQLRPRAIGCQYGCPEWTLTELSPLTGRLGARVGV